MHDDVLVVEWNAHLPKHTLMVFNEHARELVTGELALQVIMQLSRWKPAHRVTIIPVLNVWGRRYVEAGHPCQRKTERGIDPNRNYQIRGFNEHRYKKSSEEYEGPHPLSEKESKLVSSLLLQGVKRYINVHSGEKSIYMGYDSKIGVRPKNYDVMAKNIKKWGEMCSECAIGPAASTSSYRAYGTSVDYALYNGIEEAYTLEVYGGISYDCEKMFNPSSGELQAVLNKWSKIIKEIL